MLTLESYLNSCIQAALQTLNFPDISYQIDRPKQEAHGDISVNLAMLLAKPLKQNPRQIAQQVIDNLAFDAEIVEKVEIAGPGFINFFLAKSTLQKKVTEILQAGEDYGKFDIGKSQKTMVEFVSANPTGPLSVGHGRQAVLGDTLANLMEWLGYEVTREYYFNNAGRQMRVLGDSVRLRYRELSGEKIDFPEDYYQGEYISDIAAGLKEQHGDALKDTESTDIFKDAAENDIFDDIKKPSPA